MKIAYIILAFIIFGYARADQCQCCGYFYEDQSTPIYSVPDTEVEKCNECAAICQAVFDKMTNGGDINYETSDGITVAETACQNYNHDISNAHAGAYYKCKSDWTHVDSLDEAVCCQGGHQVEC